MLGVAGGGDIRRAVFGDGPRTQNLYEAGNRAQGRTCLMPARMVGPAPASQRERRGLGNVGQHRCAEDRWIASSSPGTARRACSWMRTWKSSRSAARPPLPYAAGGQGELQSYEADSRHRIVSGSRATDPQARRNGETERRERVPYEHEGSAGEINVEVVPLNSREKAATLVLFEPAPGPAGCEAGYRRFLPRAIPGPRDFPVETATSRRQGAVSLHDRRSPDLPGGKPEHHRGGAFGQRGTAKPQRGTGDRQGRAAIHQRRAGNGQRRVAGQE